MMIHNYIMSIPKAIKRIKIIVLSAYLLLCALNQISAQSTAYINTELLSSQEIVTIDSITGIADKTIPFDNTFYLKIFIKPQEDVVLVNYFRVKNSNRALVENFRLPGKPVEIEGKNVDTFFVNNKKELYIKVPPLKPGKSYDFLIVKRLNGEKFQQFVDINFLLLNNDLVNADLKYKSLSNSLSIRTNKRLFEVENPKFNTIDTYFRSNVRETYRDYYKTLPLKSISQTYGSIDNQKIEKTISTERIMFLNREDLVDELLKNIHDLGVKNENYIKNLEALILPLQNIRNSETNIARLLLLGRLPLNFVTNKTDSTASANLISRLDNLNTSKSILEKTIELINYLISIKSTTSPAEVAKLNNLKKAFAELDEFLKDSKTELGNIIKAINNAPSEKRVIAQQWISATSTNNNFVSRVEEIVVPDVGVVGFGSLNNLSSFKEVRPYYGVNINLRPVNKNIRLRNLRKKDGQILTRSVRTPWHYFSVMLGLTIGGSIQEEGERDDLFGNNSLLVGIGFRINHTIRISAGSVIFRANNPNPLIADKSIATAPFASISFDIKIQSIISSLSSAILK